mgnify:CR=1 FL=1
MSTLLHSLGTRQGTLYMRLLQASHLPQLPSNCNARLSFQLRFKAHSLNVARPVYSRLFETERNPSFNQELSFAVSNAALQSLRITLQAPDKQALARFHRECDRRAAVWHEARRRQRADRKSVV